jgi:ABC-type multidrug transport system fused ATPase/permease subunit
MLSADVALLPSGHDTRIGSNGIMLSGGQKQRVSLARALYLDSAGLLVFDDVLSGLDNDTASAVFRRVFGPGGLLRRRKATAVLCTHSVRHLPAADHVVALGADGSVVEEGTFDDLAKNKKYVHSLGVKSGDEGDASEADADKDASSAPPTMQQPASERAIADEQHEITSALDARARQLGDATVYRHYFAQMRRSRVVLFVLWSLICGGTHSAPTLWMKYWAEDDLGRPTAFYLGIFALLRAMLLGSLMACAWVGLVSFVADSGSRLHQRAVETVVAAPLRYFTTTDSGVVTNLFSQDMALIDGELPMALLNTALDAAISLSMAAVIAVVSPYMALSYPLLLLVLYVVQKFYLRTSRQMRLLDLEAKSPL